MQLVREMDLIANSSQAIQSCIKLVLVDGCVRGGYCVVFSSEFLAPPRLCVNTAKAPPTPLHSSSANAPPDTTMRLLAKSFRRPHIPATCSAVARASGRRHLTNNGFFRVSEEVREALNSNKPVVALETTIYTHGEGIRDVHAREPS